MNATLPTTHQEPSASPAVLITRLDVAHLASVSPRTIDRWVKGRKIPYIKVGRTLRFRWAAVEAALVKFERHSIEGLQ
ncbi:MAG: helix-turn-helix domain-containing protein [Verrucomicrobia bacterium]|nr:helix-turn-helix domain-containing protein [Verrucomicrobiota bacterium]